MNLLIFARDIFKKFPLLITSNILLLVAMSLVEAISIFTFIPVVDFFINPDLQGASPLTQKVVATMEMIGIPTTLGWLLAIFLAINIVVSAFQILTRHLTLRTKYALLRELMVGTFEEFFQARWYFFTSNRQGTLINTFIREMAVAGDAFGSMAYFFAGILQTILFLGVPFYISWQVTSVSLISALLFAIPFIWLGRINYGWGKLNTTTANRISSVIQEGLISAKVILGFGNQDRTVATLGQAFEAHRQVTLKSQTLNAAMPLMYFPLGLMVLTIALLTAQTLAVPAAEITALLYALFRVLPYVGSLPGHKSTVESFLPAYEQILKLRHQASELKQQTGANIFVGFKDEIAVTDLSFAHPGHEPTLIDISVRIPRGKMIAFVGESGSGKSTLIDMLMGFNESVTGQITIDGIPLSDFDINSFRQRIGYVPQESILFNLTIRDNLRWAYQAATDADIEQACRQANAHKFIVEFPEGYETTVGDRGVRLSGGQAQRIALARAILRKPDLLILDEATSALDTHSERLIQQAIETIAKDTTVVVIAHRLSTIVNADYVYVLKKGRVIEQGSYAQLVQMNGHFNRMAALQVLETAP